MNLPRCVALVLALGGCAQPLSKPSLESITEADGLAEYGEPPPGRGRGEVERLGENLFRATCEGFSAAATEQKSPDLCWAACVESIEKFVVRRGRDQRAIAEEAGWVGGTRGGDPTTIMLSLNPQLKRTYQARGPTGLAFSYPSSDRLIEAIAQGEPVIVGTREPGGDIGHVYVAHGVTFSAKKKDRLLGLIPLSLPMPTLTRGSSGSEWSIESVELFNPTPGAGTEVMTAAQVNGRIDFFFDRRLAAEMLRESMQ